MSNDLPPLKDYQAAGVEAIDSYGPGSSVLAVAPPGAGKSRCMFEQALKVSEAGGRVLIKAHRRMLLKQLTDGFTSAGISHGVIAAGYPEYERARVQIAMAQTLYSRAIKHRKIDLPKFDLVINDEAHQQAGGTDIAMTYGTISGTLIQEGFLSAGARLVGYTATPLLKSRIYHNLVELASYSLLRSEGMHQLVHTVGPEEIDVSGLKQNEDGDFSERGLAERVEVIFGSVFHEYQKLNPLGLPAILFAPSVPSSRWFCSEFNVRGVTAAHIDGESCLLMENGRLKSYPSDDSVRAAILEGSRSGDIKVICNRFVLREAIDMPWLYHAIFATVMGSPTTYLQSVGRLQRYWPEYTHKLLQCHGGCLDAKTEILTDIGWRSIGDIAVGDKVAAFNRDTCEIAFLNVNHTHIRQIDRGERMYSLSNSRVDVRITGNHRLLYKLRTCDKFNNQVWPKGYKLDRVDEILNVGRACMPISGYCKFPGVPLTDSELMFLGWWVTDGSRCKSEISISQSEHQPHIKELEKCLVDCGFDFTVTKSPSKLSDNLSVKFHIPKGTCKSRPRNGWYRYREYIDKNISPLLDNMTSEQFDVFLHAVHLGDGAKDGRDGYRICAGNKIFVDRLQAMAVCRGWKCNVSESVVEGFAVKYTLNMQKTSETIFHGKQVNESQLKIRESDTVDGEFVWCVANEWETIVTRRNGKVAIVGNSYWRHGSPNDDRIWRLGLTNTIYRKEYVAAVRKGEKPEGVRCEFCGFWRKRNDKCYRCERIGRISVRHVRMANGSLKVMRGRVYKKSMEGGSPIDTAWRQCLFACGRSGKPVSVALAMLRGMCNKRNIAYEPSELRIRPPDYRHVDYSRKVSEVYPWTAGKKKQKR